MSLPFGVYLSVVGVTIVFATLIAIVLANEAVRRIFRGRMKPVEHEGKLVRVAAVAATYYFMGTKIGHPPRRMVSEGRTLWSVVARMEALDNGADNG